MSRDYAQTFGPQFGRALAEAIREAGDHEVTAWWEANAARSWGLTPEAHRIAIRTAREILSEMVGADSQRDPREGER